MRPSLALAAALLMAPAAAPQSERPAPARRAVLVELFTSQG
jgi:hypothetical protein